MFSTTLTPDACEHRNAVESFIANASASPGTKYKFRSECRHDARLLLGLLNDFVVSQKIVETGCFADVEVEFVLGTQLAPEFLLWAALQVPDGHVSVETLEVEHRYTGDREYERYLEDDSELKPGEEIRARMRMGLESYIDSLKYFTQDATDLASSIT